MIQSSNRPPSNIPLVPRLRLPPQPGNCSRRSASCRIRSFRPPKSTRHAAQGRIAAGVSWRAWRLDARRKAAAAVRAGAFDPRGGYRRRLRPPRAFWARRNTAEEAQPLSLTLLSGRRHRVLGGLALMRGRTDGCVTRLCRNRRAV